MIQTTVRMNDAEVREAVLRRLRGDSRLKGSKVDVTVTGGTATLAGTLADSSELLAAVETARGAEGVFDVVSRLEVGAAAKSARTDANIVEAARRALEWDSGIPHARIRVAVSNGWVALHGTVSRLRERENAGRLVRRLEGARGVYNLVAVEPDAERAEDVRDRIEEALRRQALRDAERIEVQLHGGTVSLSGRLHTWAEKQAVLGALTQAPGVERVDDRLSVDPYF